MNIKSAIVRRLSQLGIDSDLGLGAHKLKLTNVTLSSSPTNILQILTPAETSKSSITLLHAYTYGDIIFYANSRSIQTFNDDDMFVLLRSRRNGVGMYEVARIASGVEEAFELLKGKLTGELKGNGKVISNALIADEVTSAPAAGATQAGRVIRVRSGAGVATSVQMCCLNSANAYEWVTLGTAS